MFLDGIALVASALFGVVAVLMIDVLLAGAGSLPTWLPTVAEVRYGQSPVGAQGEGG